MLGADTHSVSLNHSLDMEMGKQYAAYSLYIILSPGSEGGGGGALGVFLLQNGIGLLSYLRSAHGRFAMQHLKFSG